MTRFSHRIVVAALAALLTSACADDKDEDRRRIGKDIFVDVSAAEQAVCGTLFVDQVAGDGNSADAGPVPVYTSVFTRSVSYTGMEDNDLRGFVDGGFKEGWNQVSQAHLRLGRRGRNPAYGEYELFRNLQRWDQVKLPPQARVTGVRMALTLESGPPFAADIALYAVNKDWNPGRGGTLEDNNSPPAPGEVWWVDARHGEMPWASAGAGYASDTDPAADTPTSALAYARYEPGGSKNLVFQSSSLTDYARSRIQDGQPLLLLVKLTDVYEDSIGSVFEIWSANYGDDGNDRRPALVVDWQPKHTKTLLRLDLGLEAGRSVISDALSIEPDGWLATRFVPSTQASEYATACGAVPTIELLETGDAGTPSILARAQPVDTPSVVLRVSSSIDPVPIDGQFTSSIHDTWITAGPAEDQVVTWEFESPEGRRVQVPGQYDGNFSWSVDFEPDTVGRWSYRWRHEFTGQPFESELRRFDVVAWDKSAVLAGLGRLERSLLAAGPEPKSWEMLPFELAFMRIERAAAASGSMISPDGGAIEAKLRDIRALLSPVELPDEYEPRPIPSREGSDSLAPTSQ